MPKKRGPKKRANSKVSTSIRVSPDTLARLRATGNVSATVERLVRGTAPTITERPTCRTCPHWMSDDDANDGEGWCHLLPPARADQDSTCDLSSSIYWRQPRTMQNDHCSQHPDFPAYLASRVDQPQPPAQ